MQCGVGGAQQISAMFMLSGGLPDFIFYHVCFVISRLRGGNDCTSLLGHSLLVRDGCHGS